MGTDPLFLGHISLGVVLIALVKVIVAFAAVMVAVMLVIWFERKLISDMQNRIGPNRAGPYGLLQTLADGVKLFFKEDIVPDKSERFAFKLAPYLALVPALISFTIIPIGGTVHLFGHAVELQVADPPIGILLLLAMSGISVYGTMLAGWSSGSKYPLLGSVRASAQMISYEAAMGLAVVTVVLVTGSLGTRDIVAAQAGTFLGFIPKWNLIRLGVVPFLIFLVAITAEINRPPFDFTEAEQELVAGFNTEYSSIRFALFYLAEYMNAITMSAVIVTLFLGGPDGPNLGGPAFIWPILWFIIKVAVFLFFYVWVRAALPRLRYDQLMDMGWKVLIPVALAWLLVVGAMQVNKVYGLVLFVAFFLAGAVIYRAIKIGRSSDSEVEVITSFGVAQLGEASGDDFEERD